MKIEIKSRNGAIIISGEWGTFKDCVVAKKHYLQGAYLYGANLRGANLQGADLRGAYLYGANLQYADLQDAYLYGANLQYADLSGIKEYKNSHDIFSEITRRQEISVFTPVEWYAIGVIVIHRICWDEIKKQFGGVMKGIFQKLADVGFDEWQKHWKILY